MLPSQLATTLQGFLNWLVSPSAIKAAGRGELSDKSNDAAVKKQNLVAEIDIIG